jgi:hypothetical protein
LGRPVLAVLFLCGASPVLADPALQVVDAGGTVIAQLAFPPDGEICLRWAHSVTGGDVADCFGAADGALVLRRSYLHDFAAGLGEVEGRGRMIPAGGMGYWIVEIDETIAKLPVRIGPPSVGHTLTDGSDVVDLSAIAANQRVTLRVSE